MPFNFNNCYGVWSVDKTEKISNVLCVDAENHRIKIADLPLVVRCDSIASKLFQFRKIEPIYEINGRVSLFLCFGNMTEVSNA